MNLHHRHRSKQDPRRLPATKQLRWRSARRAGADAPWRRGPACPRRPHPPRGPVPGPPARAATSRPESLVPAPGPCLPPPARSSCRAGPAAPAPSAEPAARSGERKVWTRKYIARPHLRGNTGAINQAGEGRTGLRLPHGNLLRDLSLPHRAPSSPVPGARAASFLPAPRHRAPLDVAHVPAPGPRAASAARAHPAPLAPGRPRGAPLTSGASWSRRQPGGERGGGVSTRVAFSPGGRAGGRGLASVTSWGSAAAGEPGCAARGGAGRVSTFGAGEGTRRGGAGERGRRSAAGRRIRCRRRSAAAARRVAGHGEEGAGPGGPRGAAAAPGGSTRALRQAAARAHLPAAAPGRVIGCPRRAREIELSIHSRAGRARTRRRSLPRGRPGTRAASPPRRRVPARCGRAHGACSRLISWSLRVSGPETPLRPRAAPGPGLLGEGGRAKVEERPKSSPQPSLADRRSAGTTR